MKYYSQYRKIFLELNPLTWISIECPLGNKCHMSTLLCCGGGLGCAISILFLKRGVAASLGYRMLLIFRHRCGPGEPLANWRFRMKRSLMLVFRCSFCSPPPKISVSHMFRSLVMREVFELFCFTKLWINWNKTRNILELYIVVVVSMQSYLNLP